MKHFLEPNSFSKSEYNEIFKIVEDIKKYPENYSEVAKGKILATLFYEPSTRTRLSFESAMLRLGGNVLGFSDASTSSVSKGETVEDTSMTVSIYSDIIAMRHPKELNPHKASKVATVPVVNAGDGANEHPTQTLADLITIKNRFGRLNNLTIGLCGDLKYGRTVHSLVKMLSEYKNNTFIMIAPKQLRMPREIVEMIKQKNAKVIEIESMDEAIKELDVLYMTRVQRERFDDISQYEKLKGIYVLTAEKLSKAKKDMIVMHPLPRVDEIDTAVDSDERAWYFKQAEFGMYGRMALIIKLLNLENKVKSAVYGYELNY